MVGYPTRASTAAQRLMSAKAHGIQIQHLVGPTVESKPRNCSKQMKYAPLENKRKYSRQ